MSQFKTKWDFFVGTRLAVELDPLLKNLVQRRDLAAANPIYVNNLWIQGINELIADVEKEIVARTNS